VCVVIANPPNSAQLECIPTPSYIRLRAIVWECGQEQTDRYTQRDTDGRDQYSFRLGYAAREM